MDARRWNDGPIIIGWQSMPLAKLEEAFAECQRDALEAAAALLEDVGAQVRGDLPNAASVMRSAADAIRSLKP